MTLKKMYNVRVTCLTSFKLCVVGFFDFNKLFRR